MDWSAAQYTKFEEQRTRPVRDLLAQVRTATINSAADLGCGPGNSTEILQARFPGAVITGLDSSPDMVEAARKRLPGIGFAVADIATWQPASPVDLILANASLQWVPDHAAVLPQLMAQLAPGGSLAVQMPDNLDEPAHRLMREIAGGGPWAKRLAGASEARAIRRSADWYFGVLRERVAALDIWRTTYHHPLAGAAAVVEWFEGTGLRPYLDRLDPGESPAFLARYQAAIAEAYPALPDGTVLLPFPRLFFVATR